MFIRLYDKRIFAPYKCGIRHLQKIFLYEEYQHFDLPIFDYRVYFIVREPIEQLKSALHTELLDYRNDDDFKDKFLKFIYDGGFSTKHFINTLYKTIYFYKIKSKNCEIVDLKNLNYLITSFGYNLPYKKDDYNWKYERKNWIDKEQFYEYLKLQYPNEILILENWIKIQNEYYDLLIENKIKKNSLI